MLDLLDELWNPRGICDTSTTSAAAPLIQTPIMLLINDGVNSAGSVSNFSNFS